MANLQRKPKALLVNDDGYPTDARGHSPFVYPFALALMDVLGWDVRMVVPASQKSWAGKSFQIAQQIKGEYFYPTGKDGSTGERSALPRPLKDGERMEVILLEGSPATCANLGLFGLFPDDTFDLVISGPNLGRNTSTAFALSSGTVGAALSAAVCGKPAIALSWGLMTGYKPPTQDLIDGALKHSCSIVDKLWQLGWGEGDSSVAVYTVNVPLLPEINKPGGPDVQWTTMARTAYGRLFKSISAPVEQTDEGGPAAIPEQKDETILPVDAAESRAESAAEVAVAHRNAPLLFNFSPDISALVDPSPASMIPGTDTHALHLGAISVCPIRSAFEPAKVPSGIPLDGINWKL